MMKLRQAMLVCGGLVAAAQVPPAPSVAESLTNARSAQHGQYISWREHRIDDEGLSQVPIRGSDGAAVGDVDGDGHPDIVSVHEDSSHIRIAFGTPDPDKWINHTLASEDLAGKAEDVDLGDVNGDGRLDAVVACERGHLLYLEAPAETRDMSAWKRVVLEETRDRGSWIRVKLADVDRDGRLDILGANKGQTSFSVFYRAGEAADPAAWKETVIGESKSPINIQPVDLDGDGDLDVVTGSRGRKRLCFFENTGGGRTWREQLIHLGEPTATGFMMELADLNGDGRLDIVTQASEGIVFWLEQPPEKDVRWPVHQIGTIVPDHATGLELVDINGDGRLDLFTGGYSENPRLEEPKSITPEDVCGRLAWFEQPADPTAPWTRHDVSRRRRGMFDAFLALDVNRDGLIDIVTTRGNSGEYDGVLWLEQVRTATPVPAFKQARQSDSAEVPLPSSVMLVDNGRAVASIVTAVSPSDNAKAAAGELQKYVEKITGAKLPIATDDAPPSGTLVLVGESRLTKDIPGLRIPSGRSKDLDDEGLVVRTHGADRLVLAGNDTEPYLGTRYAVVEFLHRLGVRWFMPGEMGEIIPTLSTIVVEPVSLRQEPEFAVRNFWEHARGNMEEECREWKIHNKMNPDSQTAFGVPSDGSIRNYLPKNEFEAHPEWFALTRDGKRSKDHPCTTSEEMIQHVAERVKADTRKGRKVSAFAPVDGNPRCWCERCAKIGNAFDGYGANDRDPVPESSASNEWFYFVNRVLTEVNRELPDHIIATNGYGNRDIPPEMPPDIEFNPSHTLTVMFANINACTIHAYDDPKCWQMRRQGQMLQRWCELSDKVWIYNYNYTMLVNKGTITPMVHRIRRNIPLLADWGCVGFFDQDEADWALTGIPTRLVRARLEWDTGCDVDGVLDDFFTKWFGRAADPMKGYYDALEEAFDKAPQHGHEEVILKNIYTPDLMTTLGTAIESAERAAESPEERSRIQIERGIYNLLCEFVAMEKAKDRCNFAGVISRAQGILDCQAALNKFTPFMGWHPYRVYESEWEQKRMRKLLPKIDGTQGDLMAVLPETAAFRTDRFDDGRFERWQDLPREAEKWTRMRTTAGWDAQGLHDENGRPYKGVAWYDFDIDIAGTFAERQVFLSGPAVVNEAWVWVNGRYAGHRPYLMPWFRPHPMEFEITKLIKPGQSNRVTVRVLCNSDAFGANGIYERMFLYAKKAEAGQTAAP